MANLLHQIKVTALQDKTLEAISTQQGLKSWWTATCEAQSKIGNINIFYFNKGATEFHFRVDEHRTDGVRWTGIDAPKMPDEWVGTEITFDLVEDDGKTIINFGHRNWQRTDGILPMCNTTWGTLMHRLKDYLEDKNPEPFFQD